VHRRRTEFGQHGEATMQVQRKKILCVDDSDDICQLFPLVLNSSLYEVDTAQDIQEAERLAHAKKFDLYILDNLIGGESGLKLCLQLRSFDKETPILFLSASSEKVDKQRGLAAGAQAYLIKPNDLDNLETTVAHLLAACERCS